MLPTAEIPLKNNSFTTTVFKQNGSHQFYCRWSIEEDVLLSKAVAKYGPHKWTSISKLIPGRTAVQCSTRWYGALNSNVHKGRWSKDEDEALIKAVHQYQQQIVIQKTTNLPWNQIAEHIPHRTGIQCQARWTEALDPSIRKGRWQVDEDKLLKDAVSKYGCCWIRVASMIPTRTQRQCRTRWNQIHYHSQVEKKKKKKKKEKKKQEQEVDMLPDKSDCVKENNDEFTSIVNTDKVTPISSPCSLISHQSSSTPCSPLSYPNLPVTPIHDKLIQHKEEQQNLEDLFFFPLSNTQDFITLPSSFDNIDNYRLFYNNNCISSFLPSTIDDFDFLL